MSAPGRKVIQVSAPLHAWLSARQAEMEAELGRQVTFTEIIEQLREKAVAP